MKIFVNFKETRGPYGGTNSFLKTLLKELKKYGVITTNKPNEDFELAFLNALTNGLNLEQVRCLAESNAAPIVHRKVGYCVSGSEKMRSVHNGVVYGDALQIEFSHFVSHTVFQSEYSRDVFLKSGFSGDYSVIHGGTNDSVFSPYERTIIPFSKPRKRKYWDKASPLRVIISSWSTDPNKGLDEYRKIDQEISGIKDLELHFAGRTPEGLRFQNIVQHKPLPHKKLAALLRSCHVFLTLSRFETCSNSLIEAINCGLPPIYLDSGSSRELAGRYGVPYSGNFLEDLERIKENYDELKTLTESNPFKIGEVAQKYFSLFSQLCEKSHPQH